MPSRTTPGMTPTTRTVAWMPGRTIFSFSRRERTSMCRYPFLWVTIKGTQVEAARRRAVSPTLWGRRRPGLLVHTHQEVLRNEARKVYGAGGCREGDGLRTARRGCRVLGFLPTLYVTGVICYLNPHGRGRAISPDRKPAPGQAGW